MEERSFYYRYCIVIPTSYQKMYEYLEECLKANDFNIQTFNENKKRYICLGQKNEKKLLEQAEILKIKKPKNNPEEKISNDSLLDKRIIDLENKDYFKYKNYKEFLPNQEYNELYYDLNQNKKEEKNKRYGLGLFTESEMLYIEKSILENIPITDLAKFNELLLETKKKKKKYIIYENSLFDTLISCHIISESFPLHVSDLTNKISKKIISMKPNLLRSYFNDEMALYFSWLEHYTNFLTIPALISIIIFVIAKIASKKINEILYIIYAFGIIIWVQFFIVSWNRKESELKVLWGNDDLEFEKEDKRKEFVGEIRKSIITGKDELFYPEKKKLINYSISCAITLLFISFALFIHIISLNLRNLISDESPKLLLMPRYKKFGKQRLENNSLSKLILPVKNIILGIFGGIFDKVNIYLTEKENHKSKAHYYNSYIIKKFIFESLNYFFDMFYIAFALNDLIETTNTIKSFLYINEILRMMTEMVFPLIKNMIYIGNIKDKENLNEARLILDKNIDKKEILKQANFKAFNSYYEYYPLIQEFCFMTLFAFCVPLTPILLLITNNIEMRSDYTKVCLITRRPEVIKKKNIGAWKYIIEFIGIMSIITNVMFCYLYNYSSGEKKYSLITFTFWEHLLILFIVIFRFFFPLSKQWVRIYKARKFFKRRESFVKLEKNLIN